MLNSESGYQITVFFFTAYPRTVLFRECVRPKQPLNIAYRSKRVGVILTNIYTLKQQLLNILLNISYILFCHHFFVAHLATVDIHFNNSLSTGAPWLSYNHVNVVIVTSNVF